MCLLTFKIDTESNYPFVIIANRDEAYKRESAPIHRWDDMPHIIGGRDLLAGGTWLAITDSGRFAALTNQPFTKHKPVGLISRGALITDFLNSDISASDYVKELRLNRMKYDGYNLLFGSIDDLYLYDNVLDEFKSFDQGVHSVSNTKDDLSSFRQSESERQVSKLLVDGKKPDADQLITLFQDRNPNPNFNLFPDHLEKEMARNSSSIFIRNNKDFGTVSTTAIIVDRDGHASMKEVRYNSEEVTLVSEEQFVLEV